MRVAQSSSTPQAAQVPAAPGHYRVHATFRSDPAFTFSTLVDADWTFRSGHVRDGELVRLPMTAIRFSPGLDITNTTPAGRPLVLPISLDRQVGAARASTLSLTVEASFDDGRTWQHLAAARNGERGVALVHHPRGSGFVSLRAAAADTAGNTVRETIIRAYRFG